MRKVLTLAVILLTATSLFGFKTGTKSIGGSVSFESPKHAPSNFQLAPRVSYFFLDNVSLDLTFDYNTTWKTNGSDYHRERYDIGLGGRYFFKRFYAGLGFFLLNFRNKDHDASSHEKEVRVSGGYLIGIAKNIFLDIGVIYSKGLGDIRMKSDAYLQATGDATRSRENPNSGFRSTVGVTVFI